MVSLAHLIVQFHKSAKAKAAERDPGCGYDFVRHDDDEEDGGQVKFPENCTAIY